MTIAPSSQFELLTAQAGDELASIAVAAAAESADDERAGSLVIVVHPERDNHRVLSTSGVGVLRAAVSVAISSGNDRLWADAPVNDTIEHAVRSLPEVLRAAAEAHQVVATHTGTVRVGNQLEAVAIWFELDTGVAPVAHRRSTLERFAAAAERDAERAAQAAAAEAATASLVADEPVEADAGFGRQPVDLDEDDRDPITGLANRERLERQLESNESDQAALIVLGVDQYDQMLDEFGSDAAEQAVQNTTDRLLRDLRKSDLVAYVGAGVFVIVLGDLDRSTALSVSKRVQNSLTEDPSEAAEPPAVTVTVALAHQTGLVDMEELLESANSALRSGQRAGGGRLVLGS